MEGGVRSTSCRSSVVPMLDFQYKELIYVKKAELSCSIMVV